MPEVSSTQKPLDRGQNIPYNALLHPRRVVIALLNHPRILLVNPKPLHNLHPPFPPSPAPLALTHHPRYTAPAPAPWLYLASASPGILTPSPAPTCTRADTHLCNPPPGKLLIPINRRHHPFMHVVWENDIVTKHRIMLIAFVSAVPSAKFEGFRFRSLCGGGYG